VAQERRAGAYRTIVVGTDGSATAGQAVRHAARLAKATGATLHIVHAFKLIPPMGSAGPDVAAAAPIGVNDLVESNAKAVLDDAVTASREEGAPVEGHLYAQDAASALLEAVEHVGADLLVVGNKGMSGVKRFVLGSVPNKVSHHCPCNLLIVNTTS
jgi:nucleotide-binding universal stress UspA family protein